MLSVLIEVNVYVEDIEEVNDIAKDLRDILNDSGYINTVNVTDKISE